MIYAKVIGGAVLVGALLWFASLVKSWRQDALLLPVARAETVQVRQNFNAYRRNSALELARIASVSQGYSDEVTQLRADRARPVTLRVCNGAGAGPAASAVAAAPGADAAAPGAGVLPGAPAGDRQEGVDIGPELDQLARDADTVTAMARGLQAYVASLPATCMIGANGS